MINSLSLGQYKDKNSFVHTLDPRIKIAYVIFLSTLAFIIRSFHDIAMFSALILIFAVLSKIDLKSLANSLKPFIFMFLFILAMYALFSRNNLAEGIFVIWRFLMLIIISLLLTFTTTMSNLVAAVESLLAPLKIFGINVRNAATLISITVRFVPLMFVYAERTKDAMSSRLANFRKLRNSKLFIAVLLEKMFKSASNLSDAMQSRLYNENARRFIVLKFRRHDYISSALIAVIMAVFLIY